MKINDLLSNRASTRKFQDRPVSDEMIQQILQAGRLSPSGGNEQPWIFGVITERELIQQLAHLAYDQAWISAAPLIIVLCTTPVSDAAGGRDIQKQRYPDYADQITALDADLYWALNQEEHQTKIAGTHMALVALESGIGSCWVSWFKVKEVARLLRLPPGCLPSEMLVFGYPQTQPRLIPKKDLDELVFYNIHP